MIKQYPISIIKYQIAIVCVILFNACENDIQTINKIATKQEVQIETGTDIEILYSSDAIIKAKLKAPQLKRYIVKNPYTEFDKGLIAFFYDDSSKQISKLTAGYGRVNEKDNTMIVRDSVEVLSVKNEKLNTEELSWNSKTRKIFTDKFVKIQTADEIIYGDGLEANEDLTNYKIKKIRGTVSLKDDPMK